MWKRFLHHAKRAVTVAVSYLALHHHATLLRLARFVPWAITAAAIPHLLVDDLPMVVIVSILFRPDCSIMLPLALIGACLPLIRPNRKAIA